VNVPGTVGQVFNLPKGFEIVPGNVGQVFNLPKGFEIVPGNVGQVFNLPKGFEIVPGNVGQVFNLPRGFEIVPIWQLLVLIAGGIAVGWVAVLALLSALARRPAHLGAESGRLAPCPHRPNCVCSQADDAAHRIEPLRFEGSANEAMKSLRVVLAAWPRTRVVTAADGYLHAECRSRLFRFVDDVEFLVDSEARVIHFRSASRVGRSDLGVNRRRMEGLRRAFAAAR
jgi:uncharacterized protein (DUF1499 family)